MRCISLSPSLTEILRHLQASPAFLAGYTSVSGILQPEDSQEVGAAKSLDLGRLEVLSPDLILATVQDNRPEDLEKLKLKYKIRIFDVRSLQAVRDTVHELGELCGQREAASNFEKEIESERKTAGIFREGENPVRTLVLLWSNPYITVNFDTYVSRLLEACGAYNVFHPDPLQEFPVEIEEMLKRNPELLLLAGDPFPFRKRHVASFRPYRIFSQIPIAVVDGNLFSRFGPMTLKALKTLPGVLRPKN